MAKVISRLHGYNLVAVEVLKYLALCKESAFKTNFKWNGKMKAITIKAHVTLN